MVFVKHLLIAMICMGLLAGGNLSYNEDRRATTSESRQAEAVSIEEEEEMREILIAALGSEHWSIQDMISGLHQIGVYRISDATLEKVDKGFRMIVSSEEQKYIIFLSKGMFIEKITDINGELILGYVK